MMPMNDLDPQKIFYEKTLLLQFKFFLCLCLFTMLIFLQISWILYNAGSWFYVLTFYACYVGAIYSINLFFQLKTIKENIELYIPRNTPKPYDPNKFEISFNENVLTDIELELLKIWVFKNVTARELMKNDGVHPTQLNRVVRKFIRHTLKNRLKI